MKFAFANKGIAKSGRTISTQISPCSPPVISRPGTPALASIVAPTQASTHRTEDKPVEYVKVCSLYGAGFYYIPGTDTCLKLGGFVRSEWLHNAGGSFTPWSLAGTGPNSTRFTLTDNNDLQTRSRGVLSLDARTQTEYGTLRSYLKVGFQWTTNDTQSAGSAAVLYYERAFIQFAGFTFGGAQSFFDFFAYPVYSYQTAIIGSDSGGNPPNLLAYTGQLGNGVTATLSLEDQGRRRRGVIDTTGGPVFTTVPQQAQLGGSITSDNPFGQGAPDIIGTLRVDQTWGSAQIAGAAHQITPGYYSGVANPCGAATVNCNTQGHPDREWGWAALAGLELNLPTGPGDKFTIAATYASGALGYVVTTGVSTGPGSNGAISAFGTGGANGVSAGQFAYLPWADGIYGVSGDIEKIDGWSVYAGLKHGWSPNLFSTLYGGYLEFDWGSTGRNLYCTGTRTGTPVATCDPDGSFWQVGSLTQWEPVKNFTVGLDIIYNKVNTSNPNPTATGSLVALTAQGARPAATYRLDDLDWWSGVLRFQRNFWP
ncbi:MAG: porin [Rhizobiales bacterium]|nr:porin [Hyphomicrobiales bacterium]